MAEVKTFRRQLRENESVRKAFGEFVRQIRLTKWKSQADICEDPVLQRLCNTTGIGKPMTFVRLLDRTIQRGIASPKNIHRLAVALGFGSTDAMIRRFETWRGSHKPQLSSTSSRGAFCRHPDGYYWLPPSAQLITPRGARYVIQQRLPSTNSRGDSYVALDEHKQRVFIKTLTLERGVSLDAIGKRITQLDSFFNREQQMLQRLEGVTNVAHFLDYGRAELRVGADFVRQVPYLIQEYVDGRNLDVVVGERYPHPSGIFRGIRNAHDWMRYVRQLMLTIQDLHARGIRHGDLQVSNVMLEIKTDRVILVDFGQSGIPSPSERPHGVVRASAIPAPERQKYPTMPLEPGEDIFGLGKILLWMTCGAELSRTALKDNHLLRDFVGREVRTHNPDLAAANPGIIYAIAHALHENPRERASQVEELLHTLDVFATMVGRSELKKETELDPVSETERLLDVVRTLQSDENERDKSLFSLAIRREVSHLMQRTREMIDYGRLEVSGTRDRIIATMLDFLAMLEPGDLYVTTSAPDFWSPHNLGIQGRFWEANRLLAARNVRIRRLLVVENSDFVELAPTHYSQIFQAQARLMRDVAKAGVTTKDASVAGSGYYTGVYEAVDEADREAVLTGGYHIGIVQKRDSSVSLSFQVDSRQTVRKMFIWKLPAGTFVVDRLNEIGKRLAVSVPVTEWVNTRLKQKLREHEVQGKTNRDAKKQRR